MPTAAVLGTTAGLVALDPTTAEYFRRTGSFSGFNSIFSGNATARGTIAAPIAMYAFGLMRKDGHMTGTALLSGEAVVDAEILTSVFKTATGRIRPVDVPAGSGYSDTWFESSAATRFKGGGSFPSGHTIAAFSIATVISRRYGNHRWVPYAAYGMAALVGFSRVSLSSHYISDVFMGGALGYSISRFTVLRQ